MTQNQLETYNIQTTLPEYQFRSTSTCTPVVGYTSYTSSASYGPAASAPRPGSIRRGGWEEDVEEQEPIGQMTVSPVGDVPMVLMVLLMAFYLLKKTKTKIHFFNHKNL